MTEDSKRVWYENERKAYTTVSSSHLERFEKALLIASGGGFAGAASAVAADSNWLNTWFLLSFLGLGISFLCVLIGHYVSYLSNEHAIEWLDRNYLSDNIVFKPKFATTAQSLNIASVVFLVLGFLMILAAGVEKMSVEKDRGGSSSADKAAGARQPSTPPGNSNSDSSSSGNSSGQNSTGTEKK